MFSPASSVGTRLNAWNTNPTRSRRNAVSARSSSVPRSCSPTNVWPLVNVSSPAMQCISVDLPDPEGPMIALKTPASNSTVTPSSACTAVSPRP